jgi:hypothetical protein
VHIGEKKKTCRYSTSCELLCLQVLKPKDYLIWRDIAFDSTHPNLLQTDGRIASELALTYGLFTFTSTFHLKHSTAQR